MRSTRNGRLDVTPPARAPAGTTPEGAEADASEPSAGTANSARDGPVRTLRHQQSFDGLRGVAWAMVFVDHAQWLPRIAIGPDAMFVFFALSGFLITSQLVGEHGTTGRVRLGRFYRRRAFRLVPALVAMLAVWFGVSLAFGQEHWLTSVPGGGPGAGVSALTSFESVGSALLYVTNWFNALPRLHLWSGYSPLGHLWSLSVQEQFYVLWVPLMVVLLVKRPRWVAPAALVVVAVSLLESLWLLHHAVTFDRVYMATDTRAASLLLGCALAIWWARGHSRWLSRRVPSATALVLSAGILLWTLRAFRSPATSAPYMTAWILATIAGGLAVLALAERPQGFPAKVLALPLVVYIGSRSYALYLWHYVWLTWFRSFGFNGTLIALASSLACAELSWRLVETRATARSRTSAAGPKADLSPAVP